MMTSIKTAQTLNIFNAPFDGDVILMRNGEQWVLKQEMNPIGWSLFRGKEPHATIRRIPSMIELIRVIDEYDQNLLP